RLLLERVEFQGVTYATASYDTTDRVIGYMESGQSETLEYVDGYTVKRDASGNEWKYYFDDEGVITKRIDPLGNSRDYVYNLNKSLQSMTEEDGGQWQYQYDESTRVSRITRTKGDNTWASDITYDTAGYPEPAKILGPSGWGGLAFGHDQNGNVTDVRRVQTDNATEDLLYTIERNGTGEPTAVVDASGARTEYVYSTNGLVERVKLPPNNSDRVSPEYSFAYDPAGRITSITDPLSRVTTAVYDSLDRLTQATLPDPGTGAVGFVWQQSFGSTPSDSLFQRTATDFNGQTTNSFVDVWGHLTKAVDAAGNEFKLTWSDGLPVEFEDAEHNRTTYTFDELLRLKQILHPEGTTTQFTYTPLSQVETRRDRKNQLATFGYDDLGRLVTRQYPDGTIAYEYSGPVISTVRDNAEGGGEKLTSYVFDQSLRLTAVTNDRGVVEYQWLPGDMLGGYRVDAGSWINYSYYPSGDMHTIQRQGDASPFEYTYLLDGARELLRYSNNSTVNYTWDDLGRVVTLTNLDPIGGLISRYSYVYDLDHSTAQFTKKGMRVAMTEDLSSGSTGQERYFFDNLYQLTRTIYPNGEDHAWAYDRIGDRMSSSVTVPGESAVVNNYTYLSNGRGGNSQRLQSDGVNAYGWDSNGNMSTKTAADGTHYYTWNSRNMLTGITAPGLSALHSYDFAYGRTKKVIDSTTVEYQYSGWDLAKESGPSGAADYLFGRDVDEILNVQIQGSDYYYSADVVGSVRHVSDSVGQVRNRYVYGVWGEIREQTIGIPNAFLFSGRENADDGLLAYRHRYYQPTSGRFVSEDPIRFGGRDSNFFRYVLNTPTEFADPSGLWAGVDDAVFAGGGAIVGLVGQGIGDLLAGQLSGWEDYVGAAIGGAVGGEALLYTGPVLAGAAGGAAANAAKQLLKNISGKQCGYDLQTLLLDTGLGALTGYVPGAKLQGITTGRNSYNAIYKHMSSKLARGRVSTVTPSTAAKMLVGRAADTGMVPGAGAGAVAGLGEASLLSSEEECPCE
ncbi:MAG: RHS repeat protein, partial [Acidobacteria bacterium]|nr:RHS repeat protein [Acidobacteriota bacterium]